MKKFLNIIKEVALYIWQLPQNLIGLLLMLFYTNDGKYTVSNGNIVMFSRNMPGGISLGKYSIISRLYIEKTEEETLNTDVVKHEAFGHGKQSRILGPFYLPVIGLPSIIWATLYGPVIKYTKNGYYKFYTEKWADKLGGVIRS